MARLSIYVTNELKKRMDRLGESVNWSETARPVFLEAVATYEHWRQNMATAIAKYIFRKDQPLRIVNAKIADPQVIGETLDEMRIDNGGELSPKALWRAVMKDANHPLRPHFTLNVQEAAEERWTDQARDLIQCIEIVDRRLERGSVRAFVSVSENGHVSYRSIGDVRDNRDLRDALLAAAIRDLEAWKRRYADLKEACELVTKALNKLGGGKRKPPPPEPRPHA